MIWFLSVVIVCVMGVVAVVAAGRGDRMREVHRDRPDTMLPTGPLTADDLRSLRLNTAFRGYDVAEVDALLDRLIEQLDPSAQPVAEPEHDLPPS